MFTTNKTPTRGGAMAGRAQSYSDFYKNENITPATNIGGRQTSPSRSVPSDRIKQNPPYDKQTILRRLNKGKKRYTLRNRQS